MYLTCLTPTKALNPAYRKEKVPREAIDRLKRELPLLLDRTAGKVSESTLRDHLQTFLRGVAYPDTDYLVQTELRRMDTVIHDGPKRKDPVGVIIEAKTTENRSEMFSAARPNVKALHELVLYFMRERHGGNTGIKQLMITDGDAVFLFADAEFERLFWNKKRFRKKLLELDADTGKNNPLVYEAIARHVNELPDTEELQVTVLHLNLYRTYCEDGDPETDARLLPLYKILSPAHLLRRPFAGDSNHLDKRFYRELLHIIGLEERPENPKKKSGKKVIARLPHDRRREASLLENTLQVAAKERRFAKVTGFTGYGGTREEREFAVALELCLTWVNRILFLKLLETQLVSYHGDDAAYRFLTPRRIPDYDALNTLFFDVLNRPVGERESFVNDFARVPYLNSSLFEISELEDQVIRVNSLKDQHELPLADRSVLAGRTTTPSLPPLEYLFRFLDAYDFGGEGRARIQEDNKRLINASVLGLIFEKINGYRDGSFYTPGFITEYMCRETIRRAVVQKFRDDTGRFADFDAEDFADLRNYLRRDGYKAEVRVAANALVNSVTVCDPAVGSGHFLVSALNELIATKSELDILGADAGAEDTGIEAVVVNDELLISYRRDGEPYEYRVETDGHSRPHVPPEVQRVQEMLFAEKRRIIEGCLFGVDLNPNSVKICRLRLWIELLKSAYYVLTPDERSEQPAAVATSDIAYRESHIAYLQTLPNIDINIKQGNSLISRFALYDDLSGALADSDLTLAEYRRAVSDYHRARGSASKAELLEQIERIKRNFETYISTNDPRVKKLAKARGRLDQLRSLLEVGDLFGSVDEKKVRREMKPLEKSITKLEAELEGVRDNLIYRDAFEWRFEFPAVLGEDGAYVGFDVVVGNPPYVVVTAQDRIYYSSNYEGIANQFDLYQLFVERTKNILAINSPAAFIIPNSWLANESTRNFRSLFLTHFNIQAIVELGSDVFDEASVDTLIIYYTNAKQEGLAKYVEISKDSLQFNFKHEFDPKGFSFLPNLNFLVTLDERQFRLFQKIENSGTDLGQLTSSTSGIKEYQRGKGRPAQITADKVSRRFNASEKLDESFKPELRGKNIVPFGIEWNGEYISYGEWIAEPRQEHYFIGEKILIRQIPARNRLVAGYTADYFIVDQTAYVFKLDNDAQISAMSVLAQLNSTLMYWYFSNANNEFDTLFPKIKIREARSLPINTSNEKLNEQLSSLTRKILQQKKADPQADTSTLEAKIDLLVYRLYGLTHAEVLVVDPDFGLTEAEYAAVEV